MRRIILAFIIVCFFSLFAIRSEIRAGNSEQINLWLLGFDKLYLFDFDGGGIEHVESITDLENDGTNVAFAADQLLHFDPDILQAEGIRVFDLGTDSTHIHQLDSAKSRIKKRPKIQHLYSLAALARGSLGMKRHPFCLETSTSTLIPNV